jgi:hypothetical protein
MWLRRLSPAQPCLRPVRRPMLRSRRQRPRELLQQKFFGSSRQPPCLDINNRDLKNDGCKTESALRSEFPLRVAAVPRLLQPKRVGRRSSRTPLISRVRDEMADHELRSLRAARSRAARRSDRAVRHVLRYGSAPTSCLELNDSPHRRAPCRGTPNRTSLSRRGSPAAGTGCRRGETLASRAGRRPVSA